MFGHIQKGLDVPEQQSGGREDPGPGWADKQQLGKGRQKLGAPVSVLTVFYPGLLVTLHLAHSLHPIHTRKGMPVINIFPFCVLN